MIKVTRRCLRALEMWKKPWFLSQGSVLAQNAHDGRLPHGLGSGHEWPLYPRSVGRSPSQLAHQLPVDAGRTSSIEAFSPRPERPSRARSHRQYIGGLLDHRQGVCARAPLYRLVRQILLWAQEKLLSLRQIKSLSTSIREQTSFRDRG